VIDCPFDHLLALSGPSGTFEHACYDSPRIDHGYCTDDMARVLVVASRQPHPRRAVRELAATACRFLAAAQNVTGQTRNRRAATGRWSGRFGVEDCWGRSQWGLGTAANRSTDEVVRQVALAHYEHGVQQRSPWPRAMAFAALGAAEVLARNPNHYPSRLLLADAADLLGRPVSGSWPWPEPRLSYANAVLPEALLAAGDALGRSDLVDDGLTLLHWLLGRETRDGHLSFTPCGGAGPADRGPGFDQQPIEAATLADACGRAFTVSGDTAWLRGVDDAARWFQGHNDATALMWDPSTGAGYDGLHAGGVNQNQGAESTLAVIATFQQANRFDQLRSMSDS
jgi:hypothetical protein